MEFEKSSLCRVMVFHFYIEVGNLSWAVSTWEKTGQKPIIDPPGERSPGGVFFYRLNMRASAKRSSASPR